MSKIGLFYSSSTGNTRDAAEAIKAWFDELGDGLVSLHYVTDNPLANLLHYERLIPGVPTWNIGELEVDWDDVVDQLDGLDLNGKQIAIFGLGDQVGYPDTYQDAIGLLANNVRERGAELVGFTTTDGHDFDESCGVEDDLFMGLALDVDNQPELSPQRIAEWVIQLVREFKLGALLKT